MKKKVAVLLMLLLFCIAAEKATVVTAGPYDCYDSCSTGCAAEYIFEPRKQSRCDRKCNIKCSPDVAAADGGLD